MAESKSPSNDRQTTEGEGNRTADRKYREGVRAHVKSGESAPAAEDAERALEGAEADELRKAENVAKGGPQPK
jgi:hypothetical protein